MELRESSLTVRRASSTGAMNPVIMRPLHARRPRAQMPHQLRIVSDFDDELHAVEAQTKHLTSGLANSIPRNLRLGRPLSVDETKCARRGSLGMGTTLGHGVNVNANFQNSTTNALILGDSSNLLRVRQMLGQSAPSLGPSLPSASFHLMKEFGVTRRGSK
ncbi:uncharacterized protein LOC117109157 [Anneissia japonica]|uniref:uncharacterized protein LOC117109157 n=1 Tax=Anneissia japonica TaxID=1529436 RepID=UPI001425B9D3|nr:uncharacterized protein LOC117109157 [Anneissia japonica]